MKRIISLLLAVLMLVSLVGTGAFGYAPIALEDAAAASLELTANQEEWLDFLNYDNVVAIAYHMTENIGLRRASSTQGDMTIEYLYSLFEEWGYEPWFHYFDRTEPYYRTTAAQLAANPTNPHFGRRETNGHVQIGDELFGLLGPAFAAHGAGATAPAVPFTPNTVYSFVGVPGGVTVTAPSVLVPWHCVGNSTTTSAAIAFPTDFAIPAGTNVAGRVVVIPIGIVPTIGSGNSMGTPIPPGRTAVHPTGAQLHRAAVLLEEAGAAAVVFQSRQPRPSFVSPLPPFNNVLADPTTWTVGDTRVPRIPNVTSGTAVTIPVGLTMYFESAAHLNGLVDGTPITVHLETRSDGRNVLARHEGSGENAKNIYITSHFDTVIDTPGFNDSAIGVAMAMEMARVLITYNIETYHNIVFLMLDHEETGILGSRYYVSDMTPEDIENFWGLYNMDMIATSQGECIYIFMNLTDRRIQAIQHPLGTNDYLLDVPAARAYAEEWEVFRHSELAAQLLAADGRHAHRQIVVDPAHPRYGEPFCVETAFQITWGSTTDQAAWALAAKDFAHLGFTENLRNVIQVDWRIPPKGFIGTGTSGFAGALEIMYHAMGDSYYLNFSRDRLEIVGDLIFLALYHSAIVFVCPEEIDILNAPAVLRRNASVRLEAAVLPAATPQNVVWSSSNPALATVSADGVVHARVATGVVVITARTPDGQVAASVTIRLSM